MSTTIRRMGDTAALDRKFTPDEARAIVAKVKENGIVSASEKTALRSIMKTHGDTFQAGALDVIKALLDPQAPPPPPAGSQTINLNPANTERPIFLNATGVFTTAANGAPPKNDLELGEAVFRAAESADNARSPMLGSASKDLRTKTFDQLKLAIARVPADGAPPAGLNAAQALQLRASAGAVLLDLINARKAQLEPSPVFHRVVGYDDVQGAAMAKYLSDVVGAKKVFVIDNSDAYGEPLAEKVSKDLGDLVVGSDKTQVAQTDFSPTISKVESAKPDAIMYGGYIAEAAPLLKQLRDAGIDTPFIGGDGLYGADFGKAAGAAGEGAIVTCPCVPIEDGTFAADFEAETGEAPGAYAAEGFDAMSIFLDAFADGARTRDEVEAFVDGYDEQGLTKQLAFDDNGDVALENVVIWAYKVEGGALVPDQEISLG